MKRNLWLLVLLFLLVTGCGVLNSNDTEELNADVPVYSRLVSQIKLQEDYNPYMMAFSESGIFYFIQKEELSEENEEYFCKYSFFFQPYDDSEVNMSICERQGGYIRDIASVQKEGKDYLVFLWIDDDAAHIFEYEKNGTLCRDILIDQLFSSIESFPLLLALPSGEYVISMNQEIYLLNADGTIKTAVTIDGYVNRLLSNEDGLPYVIYEKAENSKTSVFISEIDFLKNNFAKTRSVPGNNESVFVFEENTFVSLSDEYVYWFEMNEAKDQILVDLKKQSILFSQIKYVVGTRDEIRLLAVDTEDPEVYLFSLVKVAKETMETAMQEQYFSDGRRIVRVAVPEEYSWQIEYYAKEYNQKSDICYVVIDRFEGTFQDYLGYGARPDVIMLNNHTDIIPLVEREILADFLPLFEKQDQYSISEIIPKARELLGDGEGMYAMTGRFQLLLRASVGTEYDDSGMCTATEYLKWYDAFLNENEITGMGNLDPILYTDICSFYNSDTGEAFFTSDAFKELLITYKEITNQHKGELDTYLGRDKGYTISRIAKGPCWYMNWSNIPALADPDCKFTGMPSSAGNSVIQMSLIYPMGILSTSDFKEGAFDFIMYYCRLTEYFWKDSPIEEGDSYLTSASFSTYEDVLNQEIFETEKPFYATRGESYAFEDITYYYYTDEQKEQLKNLIEKAVPDTKLQKDIYKIFTEEIDGYLYGNKELDKVCEILQNRISLYLSE